MRKLAWWSCVGFIALMLSPAASPALQKPERSTTGQAAPAAGSGSVPGSAAEVAAAESSQRRITAYALPPEREKKARAISKVRLRLMVANLVYGMVILLFVLRWQWAASYRDVAERVTSKGFVQAMVYVPLIVLTIDVLSLPIGIYENWIQRVYGLSVQGWGSWFWDWTKGEMLSVLLAIPVVWLLYWVIRKSPDRWWLYFWMASQPIIWALVLLQPIVVDPLFHKFEPLAKKDPALTAELEKMVQRAGESIPPERMFWMGAGEKTTALNAYVTGLGASKRIVVWDTTIAKMSTPQIVFVAGHEMGHYVLRHIPKSLVFFSALSFVAFYVGYWLSGWLLARRGRAWGIRGLEDWASFPALMLLLAVMAALAGPVGNSYSRYQEHQADQYGLEVTHGLTPDAGQVGAQSFNILGDVNLADPEPSRLRVLLFYDHPAIPDRIQFCLQYDPWGKGETGEFVK